MYYNCVINDKNNNMSKKELLRYIQALAFTVNDLALYLDTHPTSEKAIKSHNEYAKKYHIAYEEYERKYGPLSIYCPCNSWRWIASPMPWEGGMN